MKRFQIAIPLLLLGCMTLPAQSQTEPVSSDEAPSPQTIKRLAEMEKRAIATLPPFYRGLLQALIRVVECRPSSTLSLSSYAGTKSYLARREVREASGNLETVLKGFVSPEGVPLQWLEVSGCGKISEKQASALRLWISEIRVALAEGHVGNALDRLELALKFYEALAMHNVESFERANQIDNAFLILFATSLEQFTPKDCNRLIGIAKRWETLENAWQVGLERTLNDDLSQLENTIDNAGRSRNEVYRENEAFMFDLDRANSIRFAMPAPARPTQVALARRNEMAKLIRLRYEDIRRSCFSPFDEKEEKAKSLPVEIHEFLQIGTDDDQIEQLQSDARYRLVAVRLLATHVAIRKFRWEQDRLPKTLDELSESPLFVDPGAGKDALFLYGRDGDGYTLHSLSFSGGEEENKDKIVPFDLLLEGIPDFFLEEEDVPQFNSVKPGTVIENEEGQKKSEP